MSVFKLFKIKIMTNKLVVTKPFYVMDIDDVLELDKDGFYVSTFNEEFKKNDDSDNETQSNYSSVFKISKSYAVELINAGFLKEFVSKTTEQNRVNVFDEIDKLINTYQTDIINSKSEPFNLEKQTVLTNLLNLLSYLKSLKY